MFVHTVEQDLLPLWMTRQLGESIKQDSVCPNNHVGCIQLGCVGCYLQDWHKTTSASHQTGLAQS
jgi:hypothetical protein